MPERAMQTIFKSPLVSVIIPVLNAARFLGDALASVHTQTYAPLEIIVVDGPSTDETSRIARSFPRVHYMQQSGVGMWNAVNEGLDSAHGEFVAMISSDDLWVPEKIQLQVEYLVAYPEIQYVFGFTRFELMQGETPPRAFRAELLQGEHLAILLESMLARKTLMQRIGKFEETMRVASDVDWFARLGNLNEPRGVISRVLLHKRIHGNNLSSEPSSGASFKRDVLSAMRAQILRRRGMAATNE